MKKSLETFARSCVEYEYSVYGEHRTLSFRVGSEVYGATGPFITVDGEAFRVLISHNQKFHLECDCYRDEDRFECCKLTNEPNTVEVMVESLFERRVHEKDSREEERG